MMIWTALVRLLHRITRWFRELGRSYTAPRLYQVTYASEVPESAGDHILIAVGEREQFWYAVLDCPCGCGEVLQLSLLEDERPRWRLSINDGVPTLSPSIWRHRGCKSHFILRDGAVRWC